MRKIKYFFRYIKALIKHQKSIRQAIHNCVLDTGELFPLEDVRKDFQKILTYKPQITPTNSEVKEWVEKKDEINFTVYLKNKVKETTL